MKNYDELDNNYVNFEKLGHRRVGGGQSRSDFLKKSRQLRRKNKIEEKRLGRKTVRFRIIRVNKPVPKPAPKLQPKPVGPKYDGTLISIGKILKFWSDKHE